MKKLLVTILLVLVLATVAWARPGYLSAFNTQYGTTGTKLDGCSTCHLPSFARNMYGADFEKALNVSGATESTALLAVESLDSDGDGVSNAIEISAGTFPGDPSDFPAVAVESETWSKVKTKYR